MRELGADAGAFDAYGAPYRYFWLAADQSEATSRDTALRLSPLLPLAARPLPPILVAEPYADGTSDGDGADGAGRSPAGAPGALVLVQEPGGVMCVAVPSALPQQPGPPPLQGPPQQPQLPPPLPLPPPQQQQQLQPGGVLALAAPGGAAAAQLAAPGGRAARGSRGRPRS
jgi:hypothetical protein